MICLRDNRFDSFARKLERADFFSAVPVAFDGLEQQHITKDAAQVWEIFDRYDGKTLSDLQKFSNGKLITLGHIKNDDPAFFTISNIAFDNEGKDVPKSFYLNTSNLMGVLRLRHPDNETSIQMEIHSRFDKDNRQLFLNYLLSKVFQVDFMDLVSAGSNRLWDILVAIMFIQRLKEAVPIGLYKEYMQFEKNDLNFRGRLDLPRHLRQNFPLNDKIAYSYREITFDNPLNHLLRSALEMIRKKWPSLLYNDPDIRDLITALICATPTWNHSSIRDILRMPICKEVLRHPFFAEYYEESRVLAVMILQEEGLSVYDAAESEVSGIVFDGTWLWEEYISTILSPLGFLHANYDTKVGKIKLFNEAGIVGMDDIYPDFYSEARKIVLDTKYKNDKESREDIFQLLSYTFITGAEKCGLIYPPQEKERTHSNITINQKFNDKKVAKWQSFAFDAIPGNKDIIAFMQEQENRLAKYIENNGEENAL